MLFPEAFFVFHTSIHDKKTYFVWAQKYIEIRLSEDTPNWLEQDSNTIKFPIENELGTEEGNAKIESIMKILSARNAGLEFLADYELLNMQWESYKVGQSDLILSCLDALQKTKAHDVFYEIYPTYGVDFTEFQNCLEFLRNYPIEDIFCLTDDDAKLVSKVDMYMDMLNSMKMTFLTQRSTDELVENFSDTSPY